MLYYVDTCIMIYAIEGQLSLRQRARNHISLLENAGHRFVISELTVTECQVKPLGTGDGALLLDYHKFFLGPHLTTIPFSAGAYLRAGLIRGTHQYTTNHKRYSLADSLHLACAVENRIDRFLTNDQRLAGFSDISVEVLP
jgi:uncharacterized protein